jgi:hypothetical protein
MLLVASSYTIHLCKTAELQECVDIATVLIRVTIELQSLTLGIRGVGGPIDVAIITKRHGTRIIQQKSININHTT